MSGFIPNPIPIETSGNASKAYGSNISSSLTDPDGGDAKRVYRNSEHGLVLLRKLVIYSRGTNGPGRALIWLLHASDGQRECVGEFNWDSTTRGIVKLGGVQQFFYFEDHDPAHAEVARGEFLPQDGEVYVQIEDALISDGYRVFTHARDYQSVDGLQGQQ